MNNSSGNVKVSVILSVFNGEKFIQEAVDSILRQTFPFFELIIINDGSTDRTEEILNHYNDPRIRIIKNSGNLGLIASLNKGLNTARGEYIARMDADDVAEPDRLKKQLEFMDNDPQIGVSGTDYFLIDQSSNRLPGQVNLYQNLPNLLRWQLFFTSPLAHPTVIFRQEIFTQFGGYDPEFHHAEDYELWLRISPFTKFGILSEPLVSIRIHDNNISQTHANEQNVNATKASQKAISTFLGTEIKFELIRVLRNFHYIMDSSEAVELADLLLQIYGKLKRKCKFDNDEIKHIQNDILTWMTEYILFCLKDHSPKVMIIWLQLLKISPKLAYKSIIKILKRSWKYLRRINQLFIKKTSVII